MIFVFATGTGKGFKPLSQMVNAVFSKVLQYHTQMNVGHST